MSGVLRYLIFLLILGVGIASLVLLHSKPPPEILEISTTRTSTGQCRAIFSISSGRTGTGFLAFLFNHLEGVQANHERNLCEPGRIYREGLADTYEARKKVKGDDIREAHRQNLIYAESSHLFIKTFWDVATDMMLEKNCRLDVIILRRYLPEVFNSLKRNYFEAPGDWYYWQQNAISLTEYPKDVKSDGNMHILYYLLDIEAHAQRYEQTYQNHPNIHIHNWRFEDLVHVEGMRKFAHDLDLEWKNGTDLREFSCTQINQRPENNFRSESEETIWGYFHSYFETLTSQGIPIPWHPALLPAGESDNVNIHQCDDLHQQQVFNAA